MFSLFTLQKKNKIIIWTIQNHRTVELLKLLFLATGAINKDIIKTNKFLSLKWGKGHWAREEQHPQKTRPNTGNDARVYVFKSMIPNNLEVEHS